MDNIYKIKYLKYKNKYLELKGGSYSGKSSYPSMSSVPGMSGNPSMSSVPGMSSNPSMSSNPNFYFKSGSPFYLMEYLGDGKTLTETAKTIGIVRDTYVSPVQITGIDPNGNLRPLGEVSDPVHFTIFSFEVNLKHPNNGIFDSEEFKSVLKQAYKNHLKGQNLSPLPNYEKLGLAPSKKFLGKSFQLDYSVNITRFRTEIYNWLTRQFTGLESTIGYNSSRKKYTVFKVNGQELFAVPEYHYGRGNWKSHISLYSGDDTSVEREISKLKSNTIGWSPYTIGDNSSLMMSYGGRGNTELLEFNKSYGTARVHGTERVPMHGTATATATGTAPIHGTATGTGTGTATVPTTEPTTATVPTTEPTTATVTEPQPRKIPGIIYLGSIEIEIGVPIIMHKDQVAKLQVYYGSDESTNHELKDYKFNIRFSYRDHFEVIATYK